MAEATAGETSQPVVKLSRWPRPLFLVSFIVVTVMIGAGGIFVGYALRSSTEQRMKAANARVVTTAEVELMAQTIDPVSGVVGAVAGYELVPTAANYPNGATLTKQGVAVGAALTSGALVAAINDSPIFALTLTVAPWRDLAITNTGTDVLALNTTLSQLGYLKNKPTNLYSASTAAAIAALYKKAGFTAPTNPAPPAESPAAGAASTKADDAAPAAPTIAVAAAGSYIPLSAIANLPGRELAVTQSAPVGATIVTGQPAVTAIGVAGTIAAKIDIIHKQKIAVGDTVSVHASSNTDLGSGTITNIGEFSAGKSDATGMDALSGYPIAVTLATAAALAQVKAGDQTQITFAPATTEELAVPTIALRQTTGPAHVLVKKGTTITTVTVTPLWQKGGMTAVKADPQLVKGSIVIVNGHGNGNGNGTGNRK